MKMASYITEDWPIQSAQPRDSVSPDDLEESQSGQDSNSTVLQAQYQPSVIPEYSQSHGSSSPTKLGDTDNAVSPSAHLESDNSYISSPWPSKFHGADSTWRFWTARDRAIATSLDQLRATDLSVHLYNAYSLKRSAKLQATADNNAEDDTSLWHPPRKWTAWPMPMKEVPRDVVQSLDQADESENAFRTMDVDTRPSIELMDTLNAIISQEAKHRFRRRESRDGSEELEISLQDEDPQPLSNKYNDTGFKESKESCDETLVNEQAHPNLPGEHGMVFKPVLMADDEMAASILQPSVRHTLTKFDDLLMGLHHSRQAYLPRKYGTKSKFRNVVDEIESLSASTAPERLGRKFHGQSRLKRRRSEDKIGSSFESEAIPSTHKHSFQKRRKSENKRLRLLRLGLSERAMELGLRDWGDVLGVASLTDWEPSVLNRAANRCAALFGEGINFRTLTEGKDEATEISHPPLDLGANKATTSSENQSTRVPRCRNCCSKHLKCDPKRPCAPCASQGILCVPRKASRIRRTHGEMARVIDGKLYCPILSCNRSQEEFRSETTLQHHMGRVHGQKASASHIEEEMMGAVHVDGFLRPILRHHGQHGKLLKRKNSELANST